MLAILDDIDRFDAGKCTPARLVLFPDGAAELHPAGPRPEKIRRYAEIPPIHTTSRQVSRRR
jgi:hypothetical protein